MFQSPPRLNLNFELKHDPSSILSPQLFKFHIRNEVLTELYYSNRMTKTLARP